MSTSAEILMKQDVIRRKLQKEMPAPQYQKLLDMVAATGKHELFDTDKLFIEVLNMRHEPANVPPSNPGNRNFEAAIFSRITVLGGTHNFDLLKVHRTRDGSKFYVFVVVHDKWVVLEDDEMFPSDRLISALRCLTL